jgi:acyl-coenzyme A synthetase/AMP-(fatty) acid ligase
VKIRAGGTIGQALRRFGERIAVSAPQGELTFAALNAQANAIGDKLMSLGLAPGDRVAVLSHNRLELLPLWLALEKRALVRVVLHSHFDMAVHADTLREVEAKVVVFDTRFAAAIAGQRATIAGVQHFIAMGETSPDWAMPFRELLDGDTQEPAVDVDETAPCFIQLTTGTTGRPKPWIVTHRSWRAVIANNLEHLDTMHSALPAVGTQDVNLHFHALQWATGFQTLYPYLLRGARTVLVDDATFDAAAIVQALVQHHATGTLVPGPMLGPILDEVQRRGDVERTLRRMVVFFATPELLARTEEIFGPVWCHGFGSSEQGAPTTRLTAEEVAGDRKRIHSVGRPASPFFELAVAGENGLPVPLGKPGEILVRSAMSNSSYWRMPDKTAASFMSGDWFRTGDIGYVDAEGFLYYLDRDKDKISAPGRVVYPHLVEAALLAHEAVAQCGVVGLGHNGAQEVVAAVILKPGHQGSASLADKLMTAVASTLDREECPSRILFVNDLPTVLGGAKVQREVLRQRLEAAETRA